MPRKNGFNPEGMDKRAIIYERQIPRGPESLSQEKYWSSEPEYDLAGLTGKSVRRRDPASSKIQKAAKAEWKKIQAEGLLGPKTRR
jgi:hypothetical protein